MTRVVGMGTLILIAATAPAAEIKIGERAGNLSFKDIRYLPRSLDDFPDTKAFVLVFTNTSCPLVQRYLPALSRLEKEYRPKGVQFLAVNVGADDSIRAMAAQAVKHEMEFPFVKDFDAACAKTLGVKRTPEVVLLDKERRLCYRGRIDDQYRLSGARSTPSRHDLKEALDALLTGKEVKVQETPVDGCLITQTDLPDPKTPITFAEHVAPLLSKHCVECHRPGTAAPFSLITYRQVAARADAIAEVVREQRMPPWYGAPEHTEFINHRGLSASERETILQWVKGGLQRGDEAKLPKPPAAASKWLIGEPDLVVRTPEHDLPADGVIPYKYVFLPYVFPADTWLRGVQILPDNPRVLHHCNMAWVRLGEGFKITNFITGAVPGGEPMALDNGVAYRIPKGAMLVLQVHYITTGKPEKCRLGVGFQYASGKVEKQLRFVYLVDNRFAIPPGAPAHRVDASRALDCDAVGVGLFSHMHLRGRDMTFRAHYPDGRSETLLVIPNYNFDWQQAYRWEPGKKRFPRGTRLECIAHYDNSTFNPFNPDPKATVREGQQTSHEMMNGFVFYTDANERLGLDIDGKSGRVKDRKTAEPAKAPPEPVELVGKASDFQFIRDWSSYYWREDFTFLLTDEKSGKTWRVISREPTPAYHFRMGTTFTGLKPDWKTNPRVKVFGVTGIDRIPQTFYKLKLDEPNIATAFVVWVESKPNTWQEYYVNNWFHKWGDRADRAVHALYAGRKAPYDIYGFINGQSAPFGKEAQGQIARHKMARMFHGLIRATRDNPFGYEIELLHLTGPDKGGNGVVFHGDPRTIPVLDQKK